MTISSKRQCHRAVPSSWCKRPQFARGACLELDRPVPRTRPMQPCTVRFLPTIGPICLIAIPSYFSRGGVPEDRGVAPRRFRHFWFYAVKKKKYRAPRPFEFQFTVSTRWVAHAMVQEAPLKIYAQGVVSYFYFSRAPRARAENLANQQCHFKSSRRCIAPLGTDSCRGTVPMEPPMSNGAMHHREPVYRNQ
jgi:hypothetical protein